MQKCLCMKDSERESDVFVFTGIRGHAFSLLLCGYESVPVFNDKPRTQHGSQKMFDFKKIHFKQIVDSNIKSGDIFPRFFVCFVFLSHKEKTKTQHNGIFLIFTEAIEFCGTPKSVFKDILSISYFILGFLQICFLVITTMYIFYLCGSGWGDLCLYL